MSKIQDGNSLQIRPHNTKHTNQSAKHALSSDYNKADGLLPTTRKLTGHNSWKTQSPLSLRPPIYTLPTEFLQTSY